MNMTVNFEYHDVKSSETLEAFAKGHLEKLFNKYEFLIRADVFFKVENTAEETTGKISGIRLSVPGPRLFAESSKDTFKKSFSEAVEQLERQLRKRKGKMQSYN